MALWTPEYIDTALWLDAADSSTITIESGAVSQWADKSGNGLHATQDSSLNKPLYSNSEAALVFNGTMSGLTCGSNYLFFPSGPGFSAFFVSTPTKESGSAMLFSFGEASPQALSFSHTEDNVSLRLPIAYGGVNAAYFLPEGVSEKRLTSGTVEFSAYNSLFHNGLLVAQEAITLSKLTSTEINAQPIRGLDGGGPVTIGAQSKTYAELDRYYVGTLQEILFVAGVSGDERQRIEGYLAHKWGLATNLPADHPYKSAAPTIPSMSGIIRDRNGNPCQRKVYAVSRPTAPTAPQILAHGLSDPTTGAYELVIPTGEEVTRVVVSEDDDPLLKDLMDRIIPQ